MNPQSTAPADCPEFLLIFRNTDVEKRLPLEELHHAMDRLHEWLDRWTERGAIQGGQPLGYQSRVISGARQRTIADGPYAEAKEAVGGYVIVRAADLDEAAQIASEWPMLDYDAVVEVRPLLEMCAAMALVKEHMAAAPA